ncbi:FKBP-type peptidyl-prolyl cis-trans isomerase [Persicobacter psychrovividus]|uniref:peptidylprolyl isomerase n=1 Tax=Persicobacter psychrovividus TaxID=387638 RepID=A0ABM7VGL2_9BACT|nr:hypothetical protein PEPS_21140 [Persicobacter psychrovividus]
MRFLKHFAFIFALSTVLFACSENPRPTENDERNSQQDIEMGLFLQKKYPNEDFIKINQGVYKHTDVEPSADATPADAGNVVAIQYELYTVDQDNNGQFVDGHLIEKLVQNINGNDTTYTKTSVVFSDAEREIVKEEDDPFVYGLNQGNTFPSTFSGISGNIKEGETATFFFTGQFGYGQYSYQKIGVGRYQPVMLKVTMTKVFDEDSFEAFEDRRIVKEIQRDSKYWDNEGINWKEVAITENGTHVITWNRDTLSDTEDSIQRKAQVKVDYTGRLFKFDSLVFDTSVKDTAELYDLAPRQTYEPFEFEVGVGSVINGWDEGVQKMFLNEIGVLYIPTTAAYVASPAGGRIVVPEFLREDLNENPSNPAGLSSIIKPYDPLKFNMHITEVDNPSEE